MAAEENLPEGSPYLRSEFIFTSRTDKLVGDLVMRPDSIFVHKKWAEPTIVLRRMETLSFVCRLCQYGGVKHFWRMITKTWLEQSKVVSRDINRTIQLVAAYRMARLRFRAKYLAEHNELPNALHGLAKAMD